MVKGVLPAEYGGWWAAANMLTRSGTNDFHGSLFENWQDESLLARDPFCRLRSPSRTFASISAAGRWAVPSYATARSSSQHSKAIAKRSASVNGTVPTQQTAEPDPGRTPDARDGRRARRDAIAQRTDRREHRPLPCGTAAHRSDDTWLAKADVNVARGNLSVTYSRMRPGDRESVDLHRQRQRPAVPQRTGSSRRAACPCRWERGCRRRALAGTAARSTG